MSIQIRDVDWTRAVQFITACTINPDPADRSSNPITVTKEAFGVLVEVAAEETTVSKEIVDLEDIEYDDILGDQLRVAPQQAFQSMVGRVAGYLMFAAVQRHDRALVYREGHVVEAIAELGSGVHHAAVTHVLARKAERDSSAA